MENNSPLHSTPNPATQHQPAPSQQPHGRNGFKIAMIILIIVLVTISAAFAFLWKKETDKVNQYKEAAVLTKELAEVANDNMYRQFQLVDERGHWISSMTCSEIVASNDFQKTKPEYVRMKENGICDPFSDVYKPNYTALTPALQEKTSAINEIYSKLGDETLPTFEDKPNTNYLFDTCQQLIEAGSCNVDSSF